MARVFEVLDAMDALGVEKDAETYEFVARAAVATVSLKAIVDSFETMPPPHFPEVVFLGRSNVGKSSLVNSLLNRRALASVAATPGHTTRFHFYDVNETRALFPRLTLADVPGLGVAVTDQAQLDHWKSTLFHYMRERGPALRGIFHLVSGEAVLKHRRLTDIDVEIARLAQKLPVEYTLVITKVDNLKNKRGTSALIVARGVFAKLGLNPNHIVCSSIKTRRGRDKLWWRLWSCVDPDRPVWAGRDLLRVKQSLDELVDAGAKEDLAARASDLTGDGWEHAVRCLIRLGETRSAWASVTASFAPGGKKLSPVQERAALAVGEAALRVDESGSIADRELAEDVCAVLEGARSEAARAELLLELAAAWAQAGATRKAEAEANSEGSGAHVAGAADSESAFENSLATVRRVVSNAAEGGARPWSVDRWGRLLQWVLRRRDFASFAEVMDAMAGLRVKESEEVRAIIARSTAASVRPIAEEDVQPSLPGVVFLEAAGSVGEATSLLEALLPSAGGNPRAGPADVATGLIARTLELNTDACDAAAPPMTCLEVPLPDDPAPASVAEVRSLVSGRRQRARPFSVFQAVGAREFVEPLRAEVPTFGALGHRLASEEPAPGSDAQLCLGEGSLAVQASALEGGVSRYTLVVTDSDELGSEPRKRKDKVKTSRAHPKVIRQREEVLAQVLRQAAEASAPGVDIQVLLVDTRTGHGVSALWRRLWQCALPLGVGLAGGTGGGTDLASDLAGAGSAEEGPDLVGDSTGAGDSVEELIGS